MTDREAFELWAETQPPYTTHDRAFAWAIWQDARDDLRAQHAALPEPALRLPARQGGYCGYFTEKQMREYRAGAQQAEPLGDPEWEPVGRSGVLWKFRRRDNEQQAEPSGDVEQMLGVLADRREQITRLEAENDRLRAKQQAEPAVSADLIQRPTPHRVRRRGGLG